MVQPGAGNRRSSPWVSTPTGVSLDIQKYVEPPWAGKYAAFNMMIYGEPGEGKTPLLGTVIDVPIMMPALLIDCDSGTLSIQDKEELNTLHLAPFALELSEDEKRPISPWTALEEIYRWLLLGEHNYRTVMLDGGTDIQRYCELECIAYGIAHKGPDKSHDEELAELADYRRIQERMKRMYIRFKDIRTKDGRRMNLIATAHEAKIKDDLTGGMMIQPMFLGRGSPLITSVFDIVGRLSTSRGAHGADAKRLVFAVESKARGRSRVQKLGQVMENPTMKKIAEKIFPDDFDASEGGSGLIESDKEVVTA